MGVCDCVGFFFQAEDGIRDLVRSRGLGDVYKRQLRNYSTFKLINRKPIETVFPKIENEKILVSVGRGIGSKENVDVVYDFAKTIGAGIACSRPIVDNGWLPHELQVGLSGKVVAPKIYIALGISGSIQHIVGIQSSEYIIAVNKDQFAPIFKIAHLGIVGDIKKVLPKLPKFTQYKFSNSN